MGRPEGTRTGSAARRTAAGAGVVALALALAGCSSGTTVKQVSEGPGQSAHPGVIDVAGLQLAAAPNGVWPKGAHVPLVGRMVNEGADPDFLLDVGSPAIHRLPRRGYFWEERRQLSLSQRGQGTRRPGKRQSPRRTERHCAQSASTDHH